MSVATTTPRLDLDSRLSLVLAGCFAAAVFALIAPFSLEVATVAVAGLSLGHAADLLFGRLYTGVPLRSSVIRCDDCRSPLQPAYLVPLAGYLAGRGRCLDCGAGLPLRAALLPLGAEALFVGAYFALGGALLPGLAGGFFATAFLALTFTDLDSRLIPNRVVYPSIGLALAFAWVWPETSVLEVLAGGGLAIVVGFILLALSLPFGRGAFGMGDVKMIVLMGFVLGMPSLLPAIFIGTFAGGAIAALLVITRLRSRKDYLPHGPFLALGAISGLFFGLDIWHWYAA